MLFSGVFYHLKDPILGLERAASLARETLIVESHVEQIGDRPAMVFYPGSELNDDGSNWWGPNVACLVALVRDLGFCRVEASDHGSRAVVHVGGTEIAAFSPSRVTEADYPAAKEAAVKAKDTATQKLADLKASGATGKEAETKVKDAEKALKEATGNLAAFDKDQKAASLKIMENQFKSSVNAALKTAGYPAKADPAKLNKPLIVAILTLLVIYVTMVYGPIAAMLVEMFPTRIRYTSMSLPYHIGNGWFGGLLPTTAFAIVAQTGNIYNGLWYPIIVAAATFVIGLLFVRETKDVDIYAAD